MLLVALICSPTYKQILRKCMMQWMGQGFFFLLSDFIARHIGGIYTTYGQWNMRWYQTQTYRHIIQHAMVQMVRPTP